MHQLAILSSIFCGCRLVAGSGARRSSSIGADCASAACAAVASDLDDSRNDLGKCELLVSARLGIAASLAVARTLAASRTRRSISVMRSFDACAVDCGNGTESIRSSASVCDEASGPVSPGICASLPCTPLSVMVGRISRLQHKRLLARGGRREEREGSTMDVPAGSEEAFDLEQYKRDCEAEIQQHLDIIGRDTPEGQALLREWEATKAPIPLPTKAEAEEIQLIDLRLLVPSSLHRRS